MLFHGRKHFYLYPMVILDTETTGLIEGFEKNPNAEVIELAIISVDGEVLFNF